MKIDLKKLTSLCMASILTVTVSGCSKLNTGTKQKEKEETYSECSDRERCYDTSGAFSKALSEYSFLYFPKTGHTDIELMTLLEAYGISYEDFISKFVRCIYTDNKTNTYEDAYALTTVVLNRLLCGGVFGNDIIEIVTKPNQYDSISSGDYLTYDDDDLENNVGWQAIIDCLVNFAIDPTNRMHNSLFFRYNWVTDYSDCQYVLLGNRYDLSNCLKESQITYPNISLESSRNLRP